MTEKRKAAPAAVPASVAPGAPGRIVTLLTDFGERDGFVGIVKGVMLGICPSARLVDLSHGVVPQDVTGGALVLASAVGHFPPGTIHLAVVDPGARAAVRGGRARHRRSARPPA